MGKQHLVYRVKLGGINQQLIQKLKKYLTSPNIREIQKPTSIWSFFYVNDFILLYSKTGKLIFISVKSLTSIVATSFIKSLDFKKIPQEVSI